ncbi:NAD(P)H-dependent flavin oxidoreductase [Macrococcoides bohemicum]|uniref:NAD(P)H-dependent flavin oxidoreductase n=1 Tax=Macrococcoides bohemicum TaxID=1903056 RepID=UPI0019400EFD|nr:nitronate monooxygenase [Macrococcus bohemicus]QRN49001.1 nitronate monooxygenase [Macrococcus bohemicus]
MWNSTRLTDQLSIVYPIVQAGMAGSTTPELVAAISNEGGLGTIGAGYMTLDNLRDEIKAIRNLTNKSFAVNLFVPEDIQYNDSDIQKMQKELKPYYDRYDLKTADVKAHSEQTFLDKIQLLMDMEVPVASFTFGIPSQSLINELKKKGIITIGTASSVEEARMIEQSGLDMVVAQGYEAGGHKGAFTKTRSIGTMALIPQIVDSVSLPVIAAGGIMDARGILASLMLGASGMQMGTAFLTTHESKAPNVHKEAIIHAQPEDTTVTKVFSGKSARGIENNFINDLEASDVSILPYPLQNDLTTSIRQSAAKNGDTGLLHMWCSQAPTLAKKVNAQGLFREIVAHIDQLILDFKMNNI